MNNLQGLVLAAALVVQPLAALDIGDVVTVSMKQEERHRQGRLLGNELVHGIQHRNGSGGAQLALVNEGILLVAPHIGRLVADPRRVDGWGKAVGGRKLGKHAADANLDAVVYK